MFPHQAEELEPMSEMGDHYIWAEILLPRRDEMARDQVVVHSCDANRNAMGHAHKNPILKTRLYQVELEARLQN